MTDLLAHANNSNGADLAAKLIQDALSIESARSANAGEVLA